MTEQASHWLINHVDAVLAIPVVVALCCVVLVKAKFINWQLRDAVYLRAALSLATGYPFALAFTYAPFVNTFILAPQTFILVGMAVVVIAGKLQIPNYRTPSPWGVYLVAAIGHGWTRIWLYALTGRPN